MAKNPRLASRSLLDECTRLLQLARNVARRPSAGPAVERELDRARAHAAAAREALRSVLDGRIPSALPQVEKSVGGIVDRLLGRQRGPVRPVQGSMAALRERGPLRKSELLHGHSRTVSIPDLLSFLHMQRKTGVLRVVSPDEVISVHFEEGDLVGAVSSNSPPGCLLGEILVDQGALRRQQLDSFLVFHTRAEGHMGAALEVRELVTEEQLDRALTRQVQLLFHRLLAEDEAVFEFREGELHDLPSETRLNVTRLLLESARHLDEHRREDATAEASGDATGEEAAGEPPAPLPGEEVPENLEWLAERLRSCQDDDWTRLD
jgi:hypothetical protein